jgi:Cys-Gly metallodipeptidase DUG1
MVYEPMTDLIQLMSKLVTSQGKILVPGVNELVAPVTDEERYSISSLDILRSHPRLRNLLYITI